MANWAELPEDLLRSILSRLPITDFIRSRTVCISWRSADASNFRRIPLLMFPGEEPSIAALFSISEGRTYTVRLPEPDIRHRIFAGSSHGWLVTANEDLEIHLLNPLTAAQIVLPSLKTLDSVAACALSEGFSATDMLTPFLSKASLSSTPSKSGDCTVALLHQHIRMLSFSSTRDKRWTSIKTDFHYEDITFHDGRLFLVQYSGAVDVLDLTRSSPKPTGVVVLDRWTVELGLSYPRKYLVSTPSGELLQVWKAFDAFDEMITIKVYEICPDEHQMFELTSLGDRALFLGSHSSACSSVADIPELKSDHAYMTTCVSADEYLGPALFSKFVLGACAYKLEDGNMKPVFNCTVSSRPQHPVWVMPSLSPEDERLAERCKSYCLKKPVNMIPSRIVPTTRSYLEAINILGSC